MGPDKAWGAQQDLGARYRPSYPLENFLAEALRLSELYEDKKTKLSVFSVLIRSLSSNLAGISAWG